MASKRIRYSTSLTFILMLFSMILNSGATPVLAETAADATSATPKEIFSQNCAMCHGPDGAGTPLGKRMGVADLRSAVVQKQTDPALAQVVSSGRNNMPPFKAKLSDDQIAAVIKHIRQLKK
jgi:mono/diheme cytochrome c family protein